MKIFRSLTVLAISAALLMACASSPAVPPSVSLTGEYLTTDYPDAANLRNQLAFGTMKLDNTANAITPEQAGTLIPLWQAIIALSGDTTIADEELVAIQDQIVATLSIEQLQSIATLQLTNANLSAFYAEYGIVRPTPVPGATKVAGSGSSKTEEEKAAAHATTADAGQTVGTGQATKTLLFEKTIAYLMGISAP